MLSGREVLCLCDWPNLPLFKKFLQKTTGEPGRKKKHLQTQTGETAVTVTSVYRVANRTVFPDGSFSSNMVHKCATPLIFYP